jgi:hypothetical protein
MFMVYMFRSERLALLNDTQSHVTVTCHIHMPQSQCHMPQSQCHTFVTVTLLQVLVVLY